MPLLLAREPSPDPYALAQLTRTMFRDVASEAGARQAIVQQNVDNYYRGLSIQNEMASLNQRAADIQFDRQMKLESLDLQRQGIKRDVEQQQFSNDLALKEFGLSEQAAQDSVTRLGLYNDEVQSRIGVNNARAEEISAGLPLPSRDGIDVKATRYGYSGDPYLDPNSQNAIGNRGNTLSSGQSIALKASDAQALGIDPKVGGMVDVFRGDELIGTFSVDDTIPDKDPSTGKALKGSRIDFYDPDGKYKSIDGSSLRIRKSGSVIDDSLFPSSGPADAPASGQGKNLPSVKSPGASRRTSTSYLMGSLNGSAADTQSYISLSAKLLSEGKTTETAIRNQIRAAEPDITVDRVNSFITDIRRMAEASGGSTTGVRVGNSTIPIEEAAKYYVADPEAKLTPMQSAVMKALQDDFGALKAVETFLDNQSPADRAGDSPVARYR